MYGTLVAIVFRAYNAAFLCYCYFFNKSYNGAVDMLVLFINFQDELTGDFTRNGTMWSVTSNQHQQLSYTDMINKQ